MPCKNEELRKWWLFMQIMTQEQWYTIMWNLLDSEFRYACACESHRQAGLNYTPPMYCERMCTCVQ